MRNGCGHVPVLMCVFWPLGAGCATVKPGPDYERVSQYVAEATGQRETYMPKEEEALIVAQVESLLAGGLTLDEAAQVALLNNPGFQAAWMEVGMARADLVQAALLSNPSLFASMRLPAGGGLTNLEFTLSQNIADLWQIPARRRAANRALDREILILAQRAAELVVDTKSAYLRALGAQQLLAIAEENRAVAQQLLDMALTRQTAGAGSELDANLSRGAVQEAELAVETARMTQVESRRALARLLGLTLGPDELVLSDSFPDSGPVNLDIERLIELAGHKRLDIRAAEEATAQAEAVLREQAARVFKSVEIGMALERAERQRQRGRKLLADTARSSITNGGLTAPEIEPRSARRRNTDFIIGPSLGLELPIFDQNQAQIAKAAFACDQAIKQLDSLERGMIQEVGEAVDRARIAAKMLSYYRENSTPLSQRNLELSRQSYRAGQASFLSVLEAQRFYLDVRRRAVEAAQTAAATIPELERAVGVPLPQIIQETGAKPTDSAPTSQPTEGGQSQ